MRRSLRHDPPVYAPLSFGALTRAAARAARSPEEAVAELASLLRSRYGAERVVLYGSGTQALAAGIRAARAAAGGNRPIALPAYNCYDVAAAAIAADAPVLLYDIDPATLGPDWASLEAALGAGAGTVVLASLYGYPIEWTRAVELAAPSGAILIEDAAQGSGGSWQGRPLGSLGDLSVLSFGRGKGWTGGGGGALLLRRAGLDVAAPDPPARVRDARVGVLAGAQWLLSNPHVYGVPAAMPWLHLGETLYRPLHTSAGIAPFSAALLLEIAGVAEVEAEHRRRTGGSLQRVFGGSSPFQAPAVPAGGASGYLRFPLCAPSSALRDALVARYSRFGAAPAYPLPLSRLTVLAGLLKNAGRLPGASRLVEMLLTLPTHARSRSTDLLRDIEDLPALSIDAS